MDDLSFKVQEYLKANSKTSSEFNSNIILQDDGGGGYIHTWNVSGLAKPTDEQLNALASEATTLKNNNQVLKARKKLYGTTAEQLEYIVENGVNAFITKQNKIKSDNPKS